MIHKVQKLPRKCPKFPQCLNCLRKFQHIGSGPRYRFKMQAATYPDSTTLYVGVNGTREGKAVQVETSCTLC
jgi:hypothetical protein